MEERMDLAAGAAAVAAVQGLRWRRGGGGGEESDGSSGGVELSLRLRTGDGGSSSAPPATATVVAEEEREAAAAAEEVEARRRNMTIFYKGRVCAVDVTEVQARAIISMANDEMISAAADHHRQQWHLKDSGGSSSSSGGMRDGHVARPAAGSSRRAGFAGVASAAAPVIDQQAAISGLSMKRSLQRFLQKRKTRTAGAGAPPYARHAQAMRH